MERSPSTALAAAIVAALALAAGCVSSPHHLQRARALDRWQVEAVVGTALPLSTQVYDAALQAVDTLEPRVAQAGSGGERLSAAEVRDLVEASMAIVLFSPLPSTELSARLGLGAGVDVGLRLSGPRSQLDGKWQGLYQDRHGVDGALSLAIGRHSSPAPSVLSTVSDALGKVSLVDYSRTDLTLMALFSRDVGDVAAFSLALFAMRSAIDVSSGFDAELAQVGVDTSDLIDAGAMTQLGGALGLRLGYKYVFFTLELAVSRVAFAPKILGQAVDQSGWILSPAIGLVGRY